MLAVPDDLPHPLPADVVVVTDGLQRPAQLFAELDDFGVSTVKVVRPLALPTLCHATIVKAGRLIVKYLPVCYLLLDKLTGIV